MTNTQTQTLSPQQKKELFLIELENKVLTQLGERLSTIFNTCYRAPAYGWSIEEHMYMPIVADRLIAKGYSVKSSVSFEVTDWVIAI